MIIMRPADYAHSPTTNKMLSLFFNALQLHSHGMGLDSKLEY